MKFLSFFLFYNNIEVISRYSSIDYLAMENYGEFSEVHFPKTSWLARYPMSAESYRIRNTTISIIFCVRNTKEFKKVRNQTVVNLEIL